MRTSSYVRVQIAATVLIWLVGAGHGRKCVWAHCALRGSDAQYSLAKCTSNSLIIIFNFSFMGKLVIVEQRCAELSCGAVRCGASMCFGARCCGGLWWAVVDWSVLEPVL